MLNYIIQHAKEFCLYPITFVEQRKILGLNRYRKGTKLRAI